MLRIWAGLGHNHTKAHLDLRTANTLDHRIIISQGVILKLLISARPTQVSAFAVFHALFDAIQIKLRLYGIHRSTRGEEVAGTEATWYFNSNGIISEGLVGINNLLGT